MGPGLHSEPLAKENFKAISVTGWHLVAQLSTERIQFLSGRIPYKYTIFSHKTGIHVLILYDVTIIDAVHILPRLKIR